MSPLLRRTLLALALIAAVVAIFAWLGRPKPIAVTLRVIDRGKVESSIANTRAGTIEACQRAKLSTILGGRIEALPIKEGDRVKKGQLLMKLWNDDQQAQSTLAMTQVVTARQHANDLCAQAANAEREAGRQTSLREKGFISTSREDSARTEAKAKRAGCDAAQADVLQFQAKVSATRVEQGRTSLYAPFDGTVAKIVGEVGEYSTPSPPGIQMPPAVDLIDDSCLYIKAPMDEVDAPKIKAGQAVRISLDALPKQSFPGKVRRVAPYVSAVEKQARTVDIEADFDNPEAPGKLLVGYSADLEVLLDVRDDVVRVPTSALLEGGRVLITGANGTLEERKIKTGLANWEYTEVLEGLAAGDRVVTSLERAGVKAGAHFVQDDTLQGK
jgi:HlyD family secretion protein